MRVLIACECSGVVRDAFLALGHDAWSCDKKPTQVPGPHLKCDVREVLYGDWDLLIAHPVCRYLANSGSKHLYLDKKRGSSIDPERWKSMCEAADFFKMFDQAKHIKKRCVENPIMHVHALRRIGRPATQYVQPHFFGDPFKKATGLWLTNLIPLRRTHWPTSYPPGTVFTQEVLNMSPSPDREEKRSETYPCLAKAMALQWGGVISKKRSRVRI